MTINYIILAHKEPGQLCRVVEKLRTANTFFYIHIDRSQDITPFEEVLKDKPNVMFLAKKNRIASTWGSPGLVKATLQAMRAIVKDNRSGYVVLLSGQCYPIKSNQSIAEFLEKNNGYNFIEGFELPDYRWPSSTIRMQYYAFFLSRKKEDFITAPSFWDLPMSKLFTISTLKKYLKIFLHRPLQTAVLFRKRRFPKKLKPFGGMQWWALPIETVKFIIKYVDDNPAYSRYHAFTLFSDEIFFHTLVHNFCPKVKSPIMFSSWSEDEASPSPATITTAHFEELKHRRELFARKFDYDKDLKVLDLIDQHTV
jgi:hypothetical protein